MLKSKDMAEFRPTYRYNNGDGITLQSIQEAIQSAAQNYGIPVAFESEQIKAGGMFNSTTDDCLVIYHPEHPKDYWKFCATIRRQGTMAFVDIFIFGYSKLKGKEGAVQGATQNSGGITKAIVGGLFGPNKQKMQAEDDYYGAITTIFDEMVS